MRIPAEEIEQGFLAVRERRSMSTGDEKKTRKVKQSKATQERRPGHGIEPRAIVELMTAAEDVIGR